MVAAPRNVSLFLLSLAALRSRLLLLGLAGLLGLGRLLFSGLLTTFSGCCFGGEAEVRTRTLLTTSFRSF